MRHSRKRRCCPHIVIGRARQPQNLATLTYHPQQSQAHGEGEIKIADDCPERQPDDGRSPAGLFGGSAHTTRPPRMKGLALLSFTDFDRSFLGYAAIRPMLCRWKSRL